MISLVLGTVYLPVVIAMSSNPSFVMSGTTVYSWIVPVFSSLIRVLDIVG